MNIKKIISVLIAFVFVFESLGVIAYTDTEATDYEQAVNVLSELDIVNGYEDKLTSRYKLKNIPDIHEVMPWEILEEIGRERGMLIRGGEVNTERASVMLLDEYRGGKMGKISFEKPPKF